MKNMEVTHTLRLYDPEFIAKLGSLMEREKNHYRNKNEFLTAILKMGYERYIAAANKAHPGGKRTPMATDDADDNIKELYPLLVELSNYLTTQFKSICVNHTLFQKLLSSIYNIVMSLNEGNRLMPQLVNDGFYDDLPARFENIILKLETKLGLK